MWIQIHGGEFMRVLPRENPVDGVVLVVELVEVPDPKPNPEQFDQMRHSTLYGRYLPLPVTTKTCSLSYQGLRFNI